MCGIVGFYGDFPQGLISQMNRMQAHRGPDGMGIYERPGIGLGHVRLSILDLTDAAAQPMYSSDGRFVLTYNGEIYNYRELRDRLVNAGHRIHSSGDSEVLLTGLAEYGYDFVKQLNGIFAFALWDTQTSEMFLARDGMGVKPLYYSQTTQGFIFASELKSLLVSPHVDREFNPLAIQYHLAYQWCPAPHTMLEHVNKLEPGNALIIRNGTIHKKFVYYDLPYGQQPLNAPEEEIAKQLAVKVETAVNRQLVSDVPVGAFLSGGLDSSAIVAMMRKLRPDESINCYTIGFADSGPVEGNPADLPYARLVAKHLHINLHEIIVQPDMIDNLERMLFYLDEPQADPAPINALLIAERARNDGVKVLMSGAGGDDIFSGYRRHWAIQNEHLVSLPKGLRRILGSTSRAAIEGMFPNGFMSNHQFRRVAKACSYVDVDNIDERMINYFHWSTKKTRHSLYSADLAAKLLNASASTPLLHSLSNIPLEKYKLNRLLYLEAKYFLADHNLNYTDKVAMASGVEVRVPLIDPELVSFAASIPVAMKQKERIGKAIFKKSMEPYLPHDVIYRPKSGFGAPLRRWLHNELGPLLNEILSESSIRNRGLFNPHGVSNLIRLDREGRVDAAYTIFSLMCIEIWCRQFIDKTIPSI